MNSSAPTAASWPYRAATWTTRPMPNGFTTRSRHSSPRRNSSPRSGRVFLHACVITASTCRTTAAGPGWATDSTTPTAATACSISPPRRRCSAPSPHRSRRQGWPTRARASCWRSRSATISIPRARSTTPSAQCSPNRRSIGSIITSARKPCRTCSRCVSATRCSSRCGRAARSITCRSRWPRISASASASISTTAPARCATWSRTTCCSCCA